MRNYLMLGDTHGDLDFVQCAAELAAEHDAEIIQAGDWGFIWPGSHQVAALSKILTRAGEKFAKPPVTMRFIDGNHDDHPTLRARLRTAQEMMWPHPWVPIAPFVIYQPRGSVYTDEDDTTFLFCGGAPSIDKTFRHEGRSWWPEEAITEDEHKFALTVPAARGRRIDVLITHDAPDYPPGFTPKGDPEFRALSRRSMEMINELIEWHRPRLHVHGHWHYSYSRMHGNGVTKIVGLDCNFSKPSQSMWLWNREQENP